MAAPVRKLAGRPAPVDLSGPPAAPVEKVPPPVPAVPPGWAPAPAEGIPPGEAAEAVPDDTPAYAPDPDADAVAAEALRSWDDPDPSVDSWGTLETVAYHSDGTEHALDQAGVCEQCTPPDGTDTGVALQDVLVMVAGLRSDVDRLLTAVGIIGEQQQFMTNSMSAALEQFQAMMGAGGPMKMLGAMFGGKKGTPQ